MSPPELHNHCLQCGYILDGLTAGRCPECGRTFDWADFTTYDNLEHRRRRAALALWLAGGTLVHALLLAASASAWATYRPGGCTPPLESDPLLYVGASLSGSSLLLFRVCTAERFRRWRVCAWMGALDLLVATGWSIGSLRLLYLTYW